MDQLSAHLDRGWDLLNRGDFFGAQTSAEKSLEIDSESPEAHNLLGYVHAAQGNTDEALQCYRRAIALDDTFLEPILNAAELLIHPIQNLDEAMTMITRAFELARSDDEIADTLLLEFDVYMQRSDFQASKRAAGDLPEGPFDNPSLYFLIGKAKFETGDHEGANRMLQQSVKQNPKNPDSHYYLGQICETQGKSDLALIEFLRCRSLELRIPSACWSPSESQFEDIVRSAIRQLPEQIAAVLKGTLVVLSDLPGAEVITGGVDPRAGILIDEGEGNSSSVINRIFIYQRNIERMVNNPFGLLDKIKQLLESELS